MSLEYAILGFLQYGPASGYDLKEIFELSVQHFWPADQSQIYRTLTRLGEQGWAEREIIAQADHPDRKVYHITADGRAALRAWLTTPLPMKGGRSAELIQVFFAGQLPDAEIRTIFQRAAAQCRAGLAELRSIPAHCPAVTPATASPREVFCWMLTLECGVHMTEAHLAWLESVIARIDAGALPPMEETSCAR